MNATTLFSAYIATTDRMEYLVERRPRGRFGIAVDKEPIAQEWQKADRLNRKLEDKLFDILARVRP